MKLVSRKTRKAIDKTVRKAMKKHGPALVAAAASGLVSVIATLAKTEAPGKRGTSNLADLVEGASAAVTGTGKDRPALEAGEKKRKRRTEDEPGDSHRVTTTTGADDAPSAESTL
jgi:hypothetical protein